MDGLLTSFPQVALEAAVCTQRAAPGGCTPQVILRDPPDPTLIYLLSNHSDSSGSCPVDVHVQGYVLTAVHSSEWYELLGGLGCVASAPDTNATVGGLQVRVAGLSSA